MLTLLGALSPWMTPNQVRIPKSQTTPSTTVSINICSHGDGAIHPDGQADCGGDNKGDRHRRVYGGQLPPISERARDHHQCEGPSRHRQGRGVSAGVSCTMLTITPPVAAIVTVTPR